MRQYECAVGITRAAFVFIAHCNRLCNYHSYLLDIDWSLPHSVHNCWISTKRESTLSLCQIKDVG